ncbi:hypothetical protein LT330_010351 [Penicillium expansum]|nr:hypothetical protein N7453_002366 [Penicillium expansum]KAK4863870.1 hypothetical protein LT330_010351 [Penicillium expansum]
MGEDELERLACLQDRRSERVTARDRLLRSAAELEAIHDSIMEMPRRMLPEILVGILNRWIETELQDLRDEMALIQAEDEADWDTWGQWEQ